MVQRRATRFATSTYSREPGTVTNILNTLGEKLADWLSSIKLPLTFHLTSEDPPYLHGNTTLTKLSQISTSTDAYKFSFLLRTRSLPGYHARELQGHPETADVNSEPSGFFHILLALVNTEHPDWRLHSSICIMELPLQINRIDVEQLKPATILSLPKPSF